MGLTRPRLDVPLSEDGAATNALIEAFAKTLEPDSWFEVWYPATTEADYDVVRVDAEGIHTL